MKLKDGSKIIIITGLYDPYFKGGAERIVSTIVSGLHKLNITTTVITSGEYRGLKSLWSKSRITENGLVYYFYPFNVFWVNNIDKKPFWLRLIWHILDIFNLHSCLVVNHILNKEKPDLVLTHNLRGLSLLIPWLLYLRGIKFAHTVHDINLIVPSGIKLVNEKYSFIKNVVGKIFSKICKFLFLNTPVVVFPSVWISKFYESYGFFKKSKKLVLPNPVTISGHTQTLPLKDDNSTFNFVYIGQLVDHKGVRLLVDAWLELLKKFPKSNILLSIMGGGELYEEVFNISKNNPRLILYKKSDFMGVNNLLQKANVVVVPSVCYDNCPSIILESFSMGVPVLGARLGGIPELVQDYKTGLTFCPNDKLDLLKVMEYALNHKQELIKFGQCGRDMVAEHDVPKYIDKLLKFAP